MAAGARVAPAIVVALVAGGRDAVSGGGLRAGNGLPPLVRAAGERDRSSNDRSRDEKRPHGRPLLPSLAATLAWPSRYGYADIRRCAVKEVDMKLYYFPGACSQAANIALREAGLKFELVNVDRHTKRAADGLDFNEVNPKGYVPALTLDNGEVLTENVAVLQYIADRKPTAKLAPAAGTMERYRLMEWLNFINSELHKGFSPLFREDETQDTKQYARNNMTTRLEYLQRALGTKKFLMGAEYTVADAYLFTVLSWARHVEVDLGRWPQVRRYMDGIGARPNVIEALKSEGPQK